MVRRTKVTQFVSVLAIDQLTTGQVTDEGPAFGTATSCVENCFRQLIVPIEEGLKSQKL